LEINSVNNKINFEKSKKISAENKKSFSAENQTDLAALNNYKRDLVKTSFKGSDGENTLDKFKLNPNFKPSRMHTLYYVMNPSTDRILYKLYTNTGYWRQTPLLMDSIIPWKMHLYADNEEDWAKMVSTVGRYLNTQKVDWKTLGSQSPVDDLNSDEKQKGKAFTVYSSSQEQFKKLAHDIDYIIRLNGLETDNSEIKGDRKLGDTGRIFYRYDHKSGDTKDKCYHFNNNEEMKEYEEQYDPNRGENKYLADDMTEADDPFYDFDPKNEL
jgi:hypothetical protein